MQEENLSVFESLGNVTRDGVEQQSRTTAGFTLRHTNLADRTAA